LLALMEAGESYALDALAAASGGEAAALLPRLLELELQRLVRRLPGGRFVRSA
jgi:predicted Rossmann fold nucleotide-binding protein DprA/Smf involved in DNA uptake